MNRNEYKSDILKFYETFAAMSENRKLSPEEAGEEFRKDEASGSLITDSEKSILLTRITGQLGIGGAKKLPYTEELKRA